MDNNKDYIVIYSMRVTNSLIENGYTVQWVNPHDKNPKCSVFYFEKSDKIINFLKNEWNIIIKDRG